MASLKDQVYYEEFYEVDAVDDDSENMETQDDSVKSNNQNDGYMIIDGDGNYYFQTSDKLEKLTQPILETVSTTVVTPTTKCKVTALLEETVCDKKIKSEINLEQKQCLDSTTTSIATENQEVYEFNENEQDADDPQNEVDANCEGKGVVKNIKKCNAEGFSCVVCAFKTDKKYLLSNHLKVHSEERPYKCSVCERGFKTNISLRNHKNTHIGYKPHACKDCDMAFTTSGELVRHIRYRHTHIKPYKCTECEYRSVERSKLKRHMRCHTGERPYQCPHCTYASQDTFKLKRHLRIHTGEKPYQCDICQARFTQSNSLKHHRLIHSVNDKPVFQCDLCPTTCGRKTDLRIHMQKLHSSDQPIPCKRCGKELPDRYSYKMHVKTHQGEKCYRCEFCPYASVSQRHLESHVLMHLDEKPFECEICHTRFRQKQLHTRHMKIYHSADYEPRQPRKKDHKCPHCDKMFAFYGFLMRHMETHDPTSRLNEEKQNLKLGRKKRVQKDGTVITVPKYELINKETKEQELKYEGFNEEEDYEENYNTEDNDIHYVYEEFCTEDYNVEAEEHEVKEEQDINGKKVIIEVKMENINGPDKKLQAQQNCLLNLETVETKEENELSLETQDDQDFVVIELLPDDDDHKTVEDESQTTEESSPNLVYLSDKTTPNKEAVILDYFGFEVDEEEDEEAKAAMKLFEMVEQE